VKRWEYRQEAFAEPTPYPDNDGIPVFPWMARRDGSAGPFASEQDWLNHMGAEGWELVGTEDHGFSGRVPVTYIPSDAPPGAVYKAVGSVPGKRWTFRREVPA
jgi:hypothetical protein